MTSDFEGFLYQILSITIFSYLNSWDICTLVELQLQGIHLNFILQHNVRLYIVLSQVQTHYFVNKRAFLIIIP